jgi:hypothetical protein
VKYLYCPNCGKMTGHKRVIGMGTLIGGVFTLGASLNAIPFYPIRCIVCGRKSESSDKEFKTEHTESYQTSNVKMDSGSESKEMDTKKCPFCAELIKREAIKCRYCGEMFDPADVARQVAEFKNEDSPKPRRICTNGNCFGVIGDDGLCKDCGKPY